MFYKLLTVYIQNVLINIFDEQFYRKILIIYLKSSNANNALISPYHRGWAALRCRLTAAHADLPSYEVPGIVIRF
jgi:hypothetical protein